MPKIYYARWIATKMYDGKPWPNGMPWVAKTEYVISPKTAENYKNSPEFVRVKVARDHETLIMDFSKKE